MLVLDAELERRILAAARIVGLDPTEFIVRAVQRRCAEVLGETVEGGGSASASLARCQRAGYWRS